MSGGMKTTGGMKKNSHTMSRDPAIRRVLVALVALAFALVPGLTSPATAAPRHQQYLVVADPAAESLHVYRTSDLKHTGSLDDIGISGHAGTVRLPDGRLIVIDDTHGRVDAIDVSSKGRPRIVDSVDIPGEEWEGATWAATDRKQRYLVFAGEGDDATSPISVVDLTTFDIHQIQVPVAPDATGNVAETQVYLAGRPLQLVYTTGGQFHTVPLADVLAGHEPKVTSTAPVGPSTHGPVVARNGNAVFSTTATGFDGARLGGATLTNPRTVPYSSTRTLVHNYRPRMASDERNVWGAVAENTGLTPEQWADTRNDVDIIDSVGFTSRLVRLPDGVISRLAISDTYAAVSTIHPDGDVLTLLDASAGSAGYGRIVGTVALSPSTGGPVAGSPTTGTEPHFVTLDPQGKQAFVTNGGDGKLTVVDTKTRQVTKTIDTPTPLTGGGYLTVVDKDAPVHDLIAR